jgi:putative nucleotidyltransferase-like protein
VNADPVLAAALAASGREHDDPPGEVEAVVGAGRVGPLLQLARYHRMLPFVHRDLRRVAGVDRRTLQALDRHEITQTANQMRIVTDLAGFAASIAPLGIPWITFKGPVAAQRLYGRPELRTYRDLDVLVARPDFRRTIAFLERSGVEVIDRNWTLISREHRGQLHVTLALGTVVDLHWHLLNRGVVREAFTVDMDGVFARARTVSVSGVRVQTLNAADTLVHLGLHAALAGGDRLIWLKDIERAIAVEEPDWDEVVERALAWRAGAALAVMLRRAARVLEARVPVWVVRDLDPSGTRRRVGEALDRRWPADAATGDTTPAWFWPQLVRDGRLATIGSILQRSMRRPASAVHQLLGEPGGGGRDHEPAAVLHPSGGEELRERYLRELGDHEA